jgi:hypothetical protein
VAIIRHQIIQERLEVYESAGVQPVFLDQRAGNRLRKASGLFSVRRDSDFALQRRGETR